MFCCSRFCWYISSEVRRIWLCRFSGLLLFIVVYWCLLLFISLLCIFGGRNTSSISWDINGLLSVVISVVLSTGSISRSPVETNCMSWMGSHISRTGMTSDVVTCAAPLNMVSKGTSAAAWLRNGSDFRLNVSTVSRFDTGSSCKYLCCGCCS